MSLYVDGKTVLETNPTYTFTLLPIADNVYDIGSATYSYRNAHFQTAIYATSVVGNWNPSAASSYSLGITSLPWQGGYFGDDTGVFAGLNQDSVFYHRTSVLNADTALTGVIIGTPDTTALAANSLIISNITQDGDILIAVNDGGHSKQMIFLDGSTGVTHLGKPGTPGYATATGDVFVAGKLEVASIIQATTQLAVGNSLATNFWQFQVRGAFASGGGSTLAGKFLLSDLLTGFNGDTSYLVGARLSTAITTQNNSETIGVVAQLSLNEPNITKGTDTVTVASTLYIGNAPTEGETNAGIYVLSGDLVLAGAGVSDFRTGAADGDYIQFLAIDDDGAAGATLEVARMFSANDPYFSMGGSQEFKFYNSGRAELKGIVSYGAETDLTIATGVVVVTQTYHSIITEGGADDVLGRANGGSDGDILILKANTSGTNGIVTVQNGTGANTFILAGGADFIMDHVDDRIVLIHNGTEWVELSRSSNS